MVWVCKVAEVREEHRKMRRGISERRTEQHTFFALPPSSRPTHVGEVIISYSFELKAVLGGVQAQRDSPENRAAPGRKEEEEKEEG